MTPRDFLGNFFTLDPRRVDWRRTLILVLVVLLVASVLWHKLMPEVREIQTTAFRKVPEIRETVKVQRVQVPCPERGIKVLDRAALAEKLGPRGPLGPLSPLGPSSQGAAAPPADDYLALRYGDDQAPSEVLATAEVPESRNGSQVIAVMDMQTGETTPLVRENPAPWFRFQNHGAVGTRYGIDQHLANVWAVYGRYDFLRVKDVYLSAHGTLENGGDAALQLGAEYRW